MGDERHNAKGGAAPAVAAPAAASAVAAPPARRWRGYWVLGRGLEIAFLLLAGSLLVMYGHLPHLRQQQVREITRVFLGIVLEALPFMLVGSIVGGVIEVFVSPERVAGFVSRGRRRNVLLAAAMGLIFPVCECAIVPVVRRLVRKGVPLAAAVAYLLAGPIVNPIVAASTVVAYGGSWHVAAARVGLGYLIAVTVGMLAGKIFTSEQALLPEGQAGGDDHDGACRHGPAHCHSHPRAGRRVLAVLGHAATDFFDVGRFLVIGAFVAGVLRTVVNQEHIVAAGRQNAVATVSMMGLAFSLNLCSEADAFVAASFRDVVGLSGQLGFLLLGPMLDVKLLMMYLGLFRKRAILALVILIAGGVFLAASLYAGIMETVELCILLVKRSAGS